MSLAVRVSRAFFWNHANKVVGFFLDFSLSIVLARGLGTHIYGIYSELINVVVFFSLFCSLGLDTALNVYIPKYRDDPRKLSALLKRTLGFFVIFSLLICLIISYFGSSISEVIKSPDAKSHIIFVAAYLFFYTFIIIAQAILLSLFKTKFLFYANTSLKLLFIFASIFIIRFQFGLREILIAYILISGIASISYFCSFHRFLIVKSTLIDSYNYFKFGITILFTKFLNYVLGRYFDIFLLGYFGVSKEYIGFYNIAFSIVLAMSFMFTSGFAGIALTAFSDLVKRNNYHGVVKGWTTITKISVFFCLPLFLFVLLNANLIITLAYSDAYQKASILLQMFGSFFLISILFGSGANSTVLYSLHKERTVLILRSLLGSVNIVLDIVLIPKYQALGAIFATGLSTVLIIIAEYLLLKKQIKLIYPKLFLLKIISASILALSITILLPSAGLWSLLIKLLIATMVFILVIYVVKPFDNEDYKMAREVIKPLAKYLRPFVRQ